MVRVQRYFSLVSSHSRRVPSYIRELWLAEEIVAQRSRATRDRPNRMDNMANLLVDPIVIRAELFVSFPQLRRSLHPSNVAGKPQSRVFL